jgi:hypothetical protein
VRTLQFILVAGAVVAAFLGGTYAVINPASGRDGLLQKNSGAKYYEKRGPLAALGKVNQVFNKPIFDPQIPTQFASKLVPC